MTWLVLKVKRPDSFVETPDVFILELTPEIAEKIQTFALAAEAAVDKCEELDSCKFDLPFGDWLKCSDIDALAEFLDGHDYIIVDTVPDFLTKFEEEHICGHSVIIFPNIDETLECFSLTFTAYGRFSNDTHETEDCLIVADIVTPDLLAKTGAKC